MDRIDRLVEQYLKELKEKTEVKQDKDIKGRKGT